LNVAPITRARKPSHCACRIRRDAFAAHGARVRLGIRATCGETLTALTDARGKAFNGVGLEKNSRGFTESRA
jgi:hypothetical protein